MKDSQRKAMFANMNGDVSKKQGMMNIDKQSDEINAHWEKAKILSMTGNFYDEYTQDYKYIIEVREFESINDKQLIKVSVIDEKDNTIFDTPKTFTNSKEKDAFIENVKNKIEKGEIIENDKKIKQEYKLPKNKINLIKNTMKKFKMNPKYEEQLVKDIIDDYEDSDIKQLTQRDIIEIWEAGGYD